MTGTEETPVSVPPVEPPVVEVPQTEPPEDNNAEMRAFMEEYRADKQAAKEKADAEAAAAAEAEAKKKKVPAPESKKKVAPKPADPPVKEESKERAYGSARYFNRKPKRVKE